MIITMYRMFTTNSTNLKKSLVSVCTVVILLQPLVLVGLTLKPSPAEAQLIPGAVPVAEHILSPVWNHSTQLISKEGVFGIGLDALAWNVAKLAIQQMTSSLVSWINSGFNGNPSFIQNPAEFFGDLADQVLGEFIESTDFGLLCSPFQIQIKMALIINHTQSAGIRKATCTLSGILNNIENYQNWVSISNSAGYGGGGGFLANGGWGTWLDVAGPQGNNPYEAYSFAQASLGIDILSAEGRAHEELSFGGGFLSWRDCSGVAVDERGAGDSNCPIVTPGDVISTQLNKQLGAGTDTLVTADEINEIISALLQQLVSQVFSSGGLFSTSQPSPDYDWGSYLDALNNDTSYPTTVTPGFDALDPTAPGIPSASVVSPSQINLSWGAATDDVGISSYEVERCTGFNCVVFVLIATVSTTSYGDIGLTPNTSYTYRVRAVDISGHTGPYSQTATAVTPPEPPPESSE